MKFLPSPPERSYARIQYAMCALLALSWAAHSPLSSPPVPFADVSPTTAHSNPIAGVLVTVGTRSTQTQADGRFIISGVPTGSDLVRARLIGYAVCLNGDDRRRRYRGRRSALSATAVGLSALVVTGYGLQRVGDITGSITAVPRLGIQYRPYRQPRRC